MAKTRMEITAAVPGRVVSPGDQITCCIRVATDRPIQVNHGVVKLDGKARSVPVDVYSTIAASGNIADMAVMASLYERHAVVQRYGHQSFAFRNRAADNPSPLILQGGTSWDGMVTITIPSPAPDTWRGNRGRNGSVKYRVVAELRYNKLDVNQQPVGREKNLLEEMEVVVGNFVDVRDLRLHGLALDRSEKIVGLWGSSGLVKCELFLPLRTFVLGDAIPAEVLIVNQSPRTIRRATLAVFQELTFTDSISPSRPGRVSLTVTDKLHERPLPVPRVEPGGIFQRLVVGLVAPSHGLTSGSFRGCSCISVRFFVRLKVKWFFGSLKCGVDILLGSTRSSDLNGTPSTGDWKFPDQTCRSEALE